MHWLPLVAMVIASALPFPHEPSARIAAASLPPPPHHAPDYNSHQPQDYNSHQPQDYNSHQPQDYNSHQPQDHNSHQPQDYNSAPKDSSSHQPQDYSSRPVDYKSAPVDYNMAEQQNRRDFMINGDSGVYGLNLENSLEVPPTEPSPLWTPDRTEGQRDDKTYKNAVDSFSKNELQDSAARPVSQRSAAGLRRTGKSSEENSVAGLVDLDGLFDGDMFLDAHPRVLFSMSPPQAPPPLLMLEEGEELAWDAHVDGDWVKREKRSHLTEQRWGQRSVCESENVWVTNKTTAMDMKGFKVTIIQEIQTQSGPIKQYFYETRCRRSDRPVDGRHEETGLDGASCLGIDKKQWKSKCIAKPSFVRALTKDANNRMGWRWIRIDSSCVCVLLSRTNNRAPSTRGRG